MYSYIWDSLYQIFYLYCLENFVYTRLWALSWDVVCSFFFEIIRSVPFRSFMWKNNRSPETMLNPILIPFFLRMILKIEFLTFTHVSRLQEGNTMLGYLKGMHGSLSIQGHII